MNRITLFGTDGCHLCEEAYVLVAKRVARPPGIFELATMDIAESDALTARYGTRIPVLRDLSAGREIEWPFDEEALDRFLKAPR